MERVMAVMLVAFVVLSTVLKTPEHSPRTASAKYELFKICGYPSGFE